MQADVEQRSRRQAGGVALRAHNHPFNVVADGVGQPGVDRTVTGRQVFDVTGAGDTVLSVLALASAAGATLSDATMLANSAAGVVVGKLGTAGASPGELLHALDEARI